MIRILLAVFAFLAAASVTGAAFAYTQTTRHTFCQARKCRDGAAPHDLAMDQAGTIYGTTMFGGTHRFGSVYRFVPATGVLETLYSFCAQANCADGQWPYRVKLVIDTEGNLYGTASQGGAMPGDGGVVFELTAGGTYKILYTFCAEAECADGGVPATGLANAGAASGAPYDGVSPLYGSTKFDGPNGRGVIFRLKPSAHD